MNVFVSYILKGLIALLPIIILLWIIKLVYGVISGIVHYIFVAAQSVFSGTQNLFESIQNSHIATAVILVLMIGFLFSLGFLIEKNKEAIFLKTTDLIIGKIPVLSSIYSTLKEAVNLFSGKGADNYLGVVYVKIGEYKTMGFVTKEVEDTYWVFVPTTPNPTSGFLLNVKKDDVEKSDLSVANGFKKLVSLGIK